MRKAMKAAGIDDEKIELLIARGMEDNDIRYYTTHNEDFYDEVSDNLKSVWSKKLLEEIIKQGNKEAYERMNPGQKWPGKGGGKRKRRGRKSKKSRKSKRKKSKKSRKRSKTRRRR